MFTLDEINAGVPKLLFYSPCSTGLIGPSQTSRGSERMPSLNVRDGSKVDQMTSATRYQSQVDGVESVPAQQAALQLLKCLPAVTPDSLAKWARNLHHLLRVNSKLRTHQMADRTLGLLQPSIQAYNKARISINNKDNELSVELRTCFWQQRFLSVFDTLQTLRINASCRGL